MDTSGLHKASDQLQVSTTMSLSLASARAARATLHYWESAASAQAYLNHCATIARASAACLCNDIIPAARKRVCNSSGSTHSNRMLNSPAKHTRWSRSSHATKNVTQRLHQTCASHVKDDCNMPSHYEPSQVPHALMTEDSQDLSVEEIM